MKKLFIEHPAEVGETYLEHFVYAFITGVKLIHCGICCILHAIFPFVFTRKASYEICRLADKLRERE